MTDSFVALPVGQGDAFFLQRGTFTALIDGGRSKRALPKLFRATLNRTSIDVLVCTHNDADHAQGILGFLQNGLCCREVWLPALWQDGLDDLLEAPEKFFDELIGDVEKWHEPCGASEDRVRLDRLGDQFADPEGGKKKTDAPDPEAKEEKPRESELLELEDDDGNATVWPPIPWHRTWWGPRSPPCYRLSPRQTELLQQALIAASRIREIAIACAHRGVPIRWFRYSAHQASGGKTGFLEPLNAEEVGFVRARPAALKWLALTTANRQSLTFCSRPADDYPGVVLTADSDLKFSVKIPLRRGMIVTAPHHGSEANKSAYKRFNKATNSELGVVWVRSDGNFRKRPGASFQLQRTRYCTLCRPANYPKQAVSFSLSRGRWQCGSRACSCV